MSLLNALVEMAEAVLDLDITRPWLPVNTESAHAWRVFCSKKFARA